MPNTAFSREVEMLVSGGSNDEEGRSLYGRSNIIKQGASTQQAMRAAGMDFKIDQRPVFDENGEPVAGFLRNVRADTGHTIAVVKPRYKVIQNKDAFEVCEYVMRESDAYWVAGGVVGEGRKVWGLLNLNREIKIAGDQIDPFVLFTNTHDGSAAVGAVNTPIRPTCTNMLTWVARSAPRSTSIRHTGDVTEKLTEAMRVLEQAGTYLEEIKNVGDTLGSRKVKPATLDSWLKKLYPSGTDDTQAATAQERRSVVREVLAGSPNLADHRNTAWGFVNAVAEVADWGSNREKDRMERLTWSSDEYKLKNAALKIATASL